MQPPGPASSEGERPPANPAIRVQFNARSKIRNVEKGFSRPWQIYCATPLCNLTQQNSQKIEQRHLLEKWKADFH